MSWTTDPLGDGIDKAAALDYVFGTSASRSHDAMLARTGGRAGISGPRRPACSSTTSPTGVGVREFSTAAPHFETDGGGPTAPDPYRGRHICFYDHAGASPPRGIQRDGHEQVRMLR